MFVPRIRGSVGVIETPPEHKGKFAFSVWITELGGGMPDHESPDFGPIGPYVSESEAKIKLMEFVKIISETIEKKIDGKVSGTYIDMKTNVLKRWDRKDEN